MLKEMLWYGKLLRVASTENCDPTRLLSYMEREPPPYWMPYPALVVVPDQSPFCTLNTPGGFYQWEHAAKFFEFSLRLLMNNESVVTTFMDEINRVLASGLWFGEWRDSHCLAIGPVAGAPPVHEKLLREQLLKTGGPVVARWNCGWPAVRADADIDVIDWKTDCLHGVQVLATTDCVCVRVLGNGCARRNRASALLLYVVPAMLHTGMSVAAVLRATAPLFADIKLLPGRLQGVFEEPMCL